MVDRDKVYLYNKSDPIEITVDQILEDYWERWATVMRKRNFKEEEITEERCVKDWVTLNWAWEKNNAK